MATIHHYLDAVNQRHLLLPLLLLLCACGGTAAARRNIKAEVEQSAVKIQQAAAANVAATGAALERAPATNRAVQVAREFNERAAALLPSPTVADVVEYRRIVEGLLADKAADRARAEKLLADRDAGLVDLQTSHAEILAKLRETEEQLVHLGGQYEAERSKSWWTRIYAVFGLGGVVALCIAFPVLIPVLTNLLGALVNALPSLAGLFGVVSKRAMDAVVGGVETFKAKRRAEGDADAVALLKDELHKATDASHRRLIAARKVAME